MEIEIERLVHRGLGLARSAGKTIFVPGVIPGETVICELHEEKKSFARARLVKILKPSPDRVTPACRHCQQCGGCQLAHINYQRQLRLKSEVLAETIRRTARFDPEPFLAQIIPADDPLGYRSRIRLHIVSGEMGYMAFESGQFVKIKDCLIARHELRQALPALQALVRQLPAKENLEIELDLEPGSGRVSALAIGRKPAAWAFRNGRFQRPEPGEEEMDRLLAFVQANPGQNRKMRELVAEMAGAASARYGLELFAGAGNLSADIAQRIKHLVAVEVNAAAVRLARENRKRLKAENIQWIEQDSIGYLELAIKNRLGFDLVVLDPPRTGAKEEAALIPQLKPRAIIYVSCDPATLARDLKTLIDARYQIDKITPIDMFPQTFHIETITRLAITAQA